MKAWKIPSSLLEFLSPPSTNAPERPQLFGQACGAATDDARAGRERLEQFSDALLSLHMPCAPTEFPQRAMEVAARLLPGITAHFAQLDPTTGEGTCQVLDASAPAREDLQRRWGRFAREHPIVRAHLRNGGDNVSTYSLEDLLPAASRGHLPIEQELFQPLGHAHQMAVLFPVTDLATGLFLSRATPFTSSERHLVSLLAPHLAQAHHNHLLLTPPEARPSAYRNLAWQRLRSAGFSRRECEVLQWLAEGKGDDDIGLILGLSRKTVSNQVLQLMHRLQARNRIGLVTASLQIMEMPHPVELESTASDREEQFQAHLLRLAAAATPAALLQHVRQALAEMWHGLGAEAWLVRLDDPSNRFAPLSPRRVEDFAQRLALHATPAQDQERPVLGAPHATVGAIRYLPLPPSAYVWENRAAPAGELLTALVIPPERLAIAIVVRADAREFGAARLAEWHRLAPHLLMATRRTHRLAQSTGGPSMPAPPPDSPLWNMLTALQLTDRQIETLAWVAAGHSDQEIADQLGISARTIHTHLRAIFETLGVENRLAAVLEACRYFTRQLAYQAD